MSSATSMRSGGAATASVRAGFFSGKAPGPAIGRRTTTSVPSPESVARISIAPICSARMPRTSVRPTPGSAPGLKPTPLSSMRTSTAPLSTEAVRLIEPRAGMWRAAFLSSVENTCARRAGSASITARSLGSSTER